MTKMKLSDLEVQLIQAIRMRNERLFDLNPDALDIEHRDKLLEDFNVFDNQFIMPLVQKLLGIIK